MQCVYQLCSPDSVSLATAHTTSPVPHSPSRTLTTTTRSLITRNGNTPRLTPSQTMSLAWLLHRCGGGGGELTDPLEFCLSRFGGKDRGKAALTTYSVKHPGQRSSFDGGGQRRALGCLLLATSQTFIKKVFVRLGNIPICALPVKRLGSPSHFIIFIFF